MEDIKTRTEIQENAVEKNILLARKIFLKFWPNAGNYNHSNILKIAKMIQIEKEFIN